MTVFIATVITLIQEPTLLLSGHVKPQWWTEEKCMPCTPSAPADMADGWDFRRGGGGVFGSEGRRWQFFVRGGLPRALALSTYCVLLTGPWCHHRPLALTACHHVTLEITVEQRIVRTVNKDGMLREKQGFSSVSLCCVNRINIKADWA